MKIRDIQVVDLFAGPGGLGEGICSASDAFHILVSVEKDPHAHQTLRLRAYYRLLTKVMPEKLSVYLNYLNGKQEYPWDESTRFLWNRACMEARLITLGSIDGNAELDAILQSGLIPGNPWVLIGGPPCQAYSIAGRSRNKGKSDYSPEKDDRHFLYREYLRIIHRYKPTVFIMENVKGILSSRVAGDLIFHSILRDLATPDITSRSIEPNLGYRIFSLVKDVEFSREKSINSINPSDFIIRSEDYGVPQARHRVILLGIREDIAFNRKRLLEKQQKKITVSDVIGTLPPLRSKLSKGKDTEEGWSDTIIRIINYLMEHSNQIDLKAQLYKTAGQIQKLNCTGGLRVPRNNTEGNTPSKQLNDWYRNNQPDVWLNHETRGHIEGDLRRYLFAAAYTLVHGISPKGTSGFAIDGLRPNHRNWETGHFSDRFRVQRANHPATTITSHISKDGHYFIHYDPAQCRSLTVREAARIQTFPDNYFFMGNRTQQYHQVGNAVPPFLAMQIGCIVHDLLKRSRLKTR